MPEYDREPDLDFSHFHCCGDEDLYPFGCPQCGHKMVFCYECETLYPDLKNTTVHSDVGDPSLTCPACGYQFERFFMSNPSYIVSVEDWLAAGLAHLLKRNAR